MKLLFATGNPGKVVSPKRELAKFGIELDQVTAFDIKEIQADSAIEVAMYKASQAWQIARLPVMANDSGFHVEALGGFPGVYVKPVTEAIGLDGYLRLLSPWPILAERCCRFVDAWAVVFAEPSEGLDGLMIFQREVKGRLALQPRGQDGSDQKSVLWKLFIPDGWDKTLAEMTEEELAAYRSHFSNIYAEIAAWLWHAQNDRSGRR